MKCLRSSYTHLWATLGVGVALGSLFVLLGTAITPWMIAVGVICLFLVAAGLISPSIAFLLVVAVVPIERVGRFTEDRAAFTISLMRITGMLALASLLFHGLIRKWRFHWGISLYLYAGYVLCCLASMFYAQDFIEAFRAAGLVLGNLLFFFLVVNTVRTWNFAKACVQLWLLVSVIVGISTAWDWHFGDALAPSRVGVSETRYAATVTDDSEYTELRTVKRAMGPTSHPSAYGINMALTIPFFFPLLRIQKNAMAKTIIWVSLAIVFYNIFLTNTRATLLEALVALVLSGIFKLYHINFKNLVVAGVLIIALLPLVPEDAALRLLNVSNYTTEHSRTLAVRIEYWKTFLQIVNKHWLWGVGIGDITTIAKAATSEDAPGQTSVHNEFMATFLELGVIGWLFFMGFLASTLQTVWKTARRWKELPNGMEVACFLDAVMVATLTVIFCGMQCDVFHLPLKGWWLVAGISVALAHWAGQEAAKIPRLPTAASQVLAGQDA